MNQITLPKSSWELKTTLSGRAGLVFKAEKGGKTTAEAVSEQGLFIARFWFGDNEIPLTLSTQAKTGDRLEIRYLGHRIELFVDGILCDEEWPYGQICAEGAEWTAVPAEISVTPCAIEAEKPQREDVFGSFTGARGWHPGKDVWVGDCMPFSHDGVFHVFYLRDRHHHKSKWGKGGHQWAHISSRDLVHWDIHPLAVAIESQAEGSFCTGSVIFQGGKFFAFYSVRTMDGTPAPLCCSVSDDGIHFSKTEMRVSLSDRYRGESVRDPEVFKGFDGQFHMFVTTSIRCTGGWQGCLAHLCSPDLKNWTEAEPVFRANTYDDNAEKPWTFEPECASYFHKNGWYYLAAQGRYRMSRTPLGPWELPENPDVPCGIVPKMAFWENERIIFTGFVPQDGYAGTLTFCEAVQREDGTLTFIPVRETEN